MYPIKFKTCTDIEWSNINIQFKIYSTRRSRGDEDHWTETFTWITSEWMTSQDWRIWLEEEIRFNLLKLWKSMTENIRYTVVKMADGWTYFIHLLYLVILCKTCYSPYLGIETSKSRLSCYSKRNFLAWKRGGETKRRPTNRSWSYNEKNTFWKTIPGTPFC